jgi:hypothetical protein
MSSSEGIEVTELYYPTSVDLAGPWLITTEQLQALDEIIDREAVVLQTSADVRLANDLDDYIIRLYGSSEAEKKEIVRKELCSDWQKSGKYQAKREVRIWLQDQKKLSASTFKEASRHPEIVASRIVKLETELRNGETTCSLSVGGRWNENILSLSASGANQQDRERIFIAVRNWVNECQAPLWQRAWNWTASNLIQWALWWLLLMVFLGLVGGQLQSPYINEAHRLLAKGLESKDITKALEILLALQSSYRTTSVPSGTPSLFWLVALGGLFVCIALSIYPRIEVGWGKGRTRIKVWKWWMGFVMVSIPIFILSTVARNILGEMIKRML